MADTPAPVTPPGPAAFAGSPLNTLYGIDSESNLTDDQRKLARMIQGKFDASLNRRDRELAQYGAPQLSSFVEDEALARAMALARGLNIPVQNALGMVQGSGPTSRGGTGGGGGGPGSSARQPTNQRGGTSQQRIPAAARVIPPTANPSQAAKWQQIMGGLSSILPLLIGKGGMNSLMNDGLIKWVGNKFQETFGEVLDPRAAEILVNQGVSPTDGGLAFNPITGMPMAGGYGPTQDIWGDYTRTDELVGPPAYLAGGEEPFTDYGPGTEPGWGGESDWWANGGGNDWWSDGGGAGWWGDDNYWYPDAGNVWDMSDPFGVGGW
jgi:hypothetical protein